MISVIRFHSARKRMAAVHARPHFFPLNFGLPSPSVTFGHRRCDLSCARVSRSEAASTALTCEECGARFVSRLKYKLQARQHVYGSLCTTFHAPSSNLSSQRLRAGNEESGSTRLKFRRHCIRDSKPIAVIGFHVVFPSQKEDRSAMPAHVRIRFGRACKWIRP
jgi:hypothetical protein